MPSLLAGEAPRERRNVAFGWKAEIAFDGRSRQFLGMTVSKIFALSLLCIASKAFAADDVDPQSLPLSCPERWGAPGDPLVGTEQTAKAIFAAVEREFFPGADRRHYPDVRVRDGGTYWAVFRMRNASRDRPKDAEIILHSAGHQLSLQVDKCTAAISKVHYSR